MLCTGCYDEQKGLDHDVALEDVEITFPESAYSASLGEDIVITPTVVTTIPDDDLQYIWEANGNVYNKNGRNTFTPLVNDDEQAKTLKYTCHLDSNIVSLNTAYTCRLHVKQKSTGRDFYSSSTFTITIAGVTGLMILHGDAQSSDIGILQAEEFTPSSNTVPETSKTTSNFYSLNNAGATIEGEGRSIVQSVMSYGYSSVYDRYRIVTITDKGAVVANMSDLSQYGTWDKLFYLQGAKKKHSGNPKGYTPISSVAVAFDGDDIFVMDQNSTYPFLYAEVDKDTYSADGHKIVYYPAIIKASGSGLQAMLFANSVDGSSHKGFVKLMQTSYWDRGCWTLSLLDTKSDNVKFNPGNIHGDLMRMYCDGRSHLMSVLKGDATNSQFAGKYFAVDIDLYGGSTEQSLSGYDLMPKYIYDLSACKDIDNAKFFEFGETVTMCYYATANGLYHYTLNDGVTGEAAPITMSGGAAVNIEGEITMMKLLNSPNISTHNSEPILLVATYTGSNAKLYALHIDTLTGLVSRVVLYDESTVKGWNYGRIKDANLKGM